MEAGVPKPVVDTQIFENLIISARVDFGVFVELVLFYSASGQVPGARPLY
jgi:hypothetical protein